ncbi:hypothetical protein GA0070616_4727 [Micromonospora nigra]|uniref:Uncharacterized protein n=1 Tax=Micromonospora nigra TaxID=145857 RepID=A0A1C6SW41_9ACTN|nr:hypothetical protein [Micromonospora nigra]SCL33483.1 hypothetical protein GA0070616_4727 [Micromonospora nigra]
MRGVPLAPRHRRDWRRWGIWCVCGLRWRTCPDRRTPVPVEPHATRSLARRPRAAATCRLRAGRRR